MPAVAYSPKYKASDYRAWEGDWELWDGVAISMSPSPDFFHQKATTRCLRMIGNQLEENPVCEDNCEAIAECDWYVSEFTVVRPDGFVFCGEPEGRFIRDRPELIIEALSPSTREKDLTSKRDLYAQEGVPFYLILDPEDESVTLLELEEKGRYRERSAEESFELHPGCVLTLDADAVFA